MTDTTERININPGDTVIKDGTRYVVQQGAEVDATEKQSRKQATRLLKASCSGCGYTVRVTKRWADKGLPVCPLCTRYEEQNGLMVLAHLQTMDLEVITTPDGGIDLPTA